MQLAETKTPTEDEWLEFILSFDRVIPRIVRKYTIDNGLREDAAQEARIALWLLREKITRVKGYDDYASGTITLYEWTALDRYCRNVARNTALNLLQKWSTGSWEHGRTSGGKHYGAKYARLDDLTEMGFQVDEDYNVSFEPYYLSELSDDQY